MKQRLVALAVAGLVGVTGLAACSTDDSSDAKVERKGDELTVQKGDKSLSLGDAKIPASFPSDQVPLPTAGTLKAVVGGKDARGKYYSLTYSVNGDELKDVAADYKDQMGDQGYRIQASSSVGDAAAVFSAFTAVGPHWDVIVYGGGAGANGALSLQVTPHDTSTDVPGSDGGSGSQTG